MVRPRMLIFRTLYCIFVYTELCLSHHGLEPLPRLGVHLTSTPRPRSVKYGPGARLTIIFSHPNFYPSWNLRLEPALPRTLPRESLCPISRTTSSGLLHKAPVVHSCPTTSWRDKDFHPGLGANSQVPSLTAKAQSSDFTPSPVTGINGPFVPEVEGPDLVLRPPIAEMWKFLVSKGCLL